MSRLTRDGTAEPVSRDQILRRERGQGKARFPYSADHDEQDWQSYPRLIHTLLYVMTMHAYIHTHSTTVREPLYHHFMQTPSKTDAQQYYSIIRAATGGKDQCSLSLLSRHLLRRTVRKPMYNHVRISSSSSSSSSRGRRQGLIFSSFFNNVLLPFNVRPATWVCCCRC